MTKKNRKPGWKILGANFIVKAGQERKLALERNDHFQDVPAITVTVDGGWSERSHKHSYNAKSGMALSTE